MRDADPKKSSAKAQARGRIFFFFLQERRDVICDEREREDVHYTAEIAISRDLSLAAAASLSRPPRAFFLRERLLAFVPRYTWTKFNYVCIQGRERDGDILAERCTIFKRVCRYILLCPRVMWMGCDGNSGNAI